MDLPNISRNLIRAWTSTIAYTLQVAQIKNKSLKQTIPESEANTFNNLIDDKHLIGVTGNKIVNKPSRHIDIMISHFDWEECHPTFNLNKAGRWLKFLVVFEVLCPLTCINRVKRDKKAIKTFKSWRLSQTWLLNPDSIWFQRSFRLHTPDQSDTWVKYKWTEGSISDLGTGPISSL